MRPSSFPSLSIAQFPAKLREKEQFPSKIVKIINYLFCAKLLISKLLFFSLNYCPKEKKCWIKIHWHLYQNTEIASFRWSDCLLVILTKVSFWFEVAPRWNHFIYHEVELPFWNVIFFRNIETWNCMTQRKPIHVLICLQQ